MKKILLLGFVFILLISFVGAAVDLTDNNILAYSFDDDDILRTRDPADSSGNGYSGVGTSVITGATGKLDEAFKFVPSGDYVNIDNSSFNTLCTSACSFSFWFNTTGTGDREIIQKQTSGADGFGCYVANSDSKLHCFADCSGGADYGGKSTTTVTTGALFHGVYVIEASGSTRIYINGVEEYSNSRPSGTCDNPNSNSFGIGYRRFNTDFYYRGNIDMMLIYTDALNTSEIAALYNSGSGFDPYAPIISGDAYLNIRNSTLAPETAYTNDTLLGSFEGNATGLLRGYSKYYINGVASSTDLYGVNLVNNTLTNIYNISSSLFNKTDVIIFSSLASNFTDNTTWLNSSSVTILNKPPIIQNLAPPDDYANNIFLNVSFDLVEIDKDTVSCGLYIDDVLINTSAGLTDGNSYTLIGNTSNETDYSWFLNCTDGEITTTTPRTYTYDITYPQFNILTSGEEFIDQYLDERRVNYTVTVNISDTNLYGFNTTCILDNGTVLYQNVTTNLNVSSLLYTIDFSLDGLTYDGYDKNITCTQTIADDHTDKNYKPEKVLKKSNYELEVDNVIFKLIDANATNLKLFKHNYGVSFEFIQTPEDKIKEKTYAVYCAADNFDYRENSYFPGHFVCGDQWIDALNTGNHKVKIDYVKEKDGDPAHYEIKTKATKFKSIGGLNFNITSWSMGLYDMRVNAFYYNNISDTWLTGFTSRLSLISNTSLYNENFTTSNYSRTYGMYNNLYNLSIVGRTDWALVNVTNQTEINVTLIFTPISAVLVNIYDYDTNALLLQAVNVSLISNVSGSVNTTLVGYMLYDLVTPNDYEIRLESTNYNPISKFVTILNGSFQQIDTYMTRNVSIELQTIQVIDTSGQNVENAIVRLQKETLIDGALEWITIQEANTNTEGKTTVWIQRDTTIFYRFAVIYNGVARPILPSENLFTTKTYFIPNVEETIQLQISLEDDPTDFISDTFSIATDLYIGGSDNKTVYYEWLDGRNNINGARLLIYGKYLNSTSDYELLSNQYLGAVSGTINYTFVVTNNSIYNIKGYIVLGDLTEELTQELVKRYDADVIVDKNTGLLYAALVLMVVALVTVRFSPLISAGITIGSLYFLTKIHIVDIPTTIVTSFLAFAVILFIEWKKKNA